MKLLFAALAARGALADWTEHGIAVGNGFSIYISPYTQEVLAMGDNRKGQLGTAPLGENDTEPLGWQTVVLDASVEVTGVSAGSHHVLYVTEQGDAYAAGSNSMGQIGVNYPNDASTVVKVLDGANGKVKAVAAGNAHSLFLMEDGTVKASGCNMNGEIGMGVDMSMSQTPQVVPGLTGIQAISAGYDFSYFLGQGDVHASGQNLNGQLGDGTTRTRFVPTKSAIAGVSAITAGESHGLFLKNGEVVVTGSAFNGQIGDRTNFVTTPASTGIMAANVFAGGDSSCYTTSDSSLCMGSNYFGQIGLGAVKWTATPTEVLADGSPDVSIGVMHSLFLMMNGQVQGTGSNARGQLGSSSSDVLFSLGGATTVAPTTEAPTDEPSTSSSDENNNGTTTNPSRGSRSFFDTNGTQIWIASVAIAIVLLGCNLMRAEQEEEELLDETAEQSPEDLELARAQLSLIHI